MAEKHKYQAYAAATQTVAPVRQIVLLYDGAIRLVQQAKEAIAEKRIEDRYNLLIKTSELIGGLQSCLDFDNGGEIAKILYSYYSSIDARLFAIHRSNSIEECDSIINDLKEMRNSWNEIAHSEASSSSKDTVNMAGISDNSVPPPPSVEGLTLSA